VVQVAAIFVMAALTESLPSACILQQKYENTKREITTRGGRGRTNIGNMSYVLEFTLAQDLRIHEKAKL
jgi:hypothetical protein